MMVATPLLSFPLQVRRLHSPSLVGGGSIRP